MFCHFYYYGNIYVIHVFTSHNYINIFLIWIAIYIVLLSRSIIYNVYHAPVYYFYTIPLKVIAVFFLEFECISTGVLVVVVVVVVDLPLLCVAVEGSDNPISLEKPCQASLPPDQQGHHSLGRHPEVQHIA